MNANQLARCVAQHLPGWTSQDNDAQVGILKRADGATIHLRLRNERVEVSGTYPVDVRPYGTSHPTITVSAGRAPKAIAAEIQRRFLPEYDTLYAEAVAVQDRDRRNFVWEVQTSQRLAGQLGARYVAPETNARYDERNSAHLSFGDSLALTFRAKAYDHTIQLERTYMPVELFDRLAAVIAAWIEEQSSGKE